MAKKSIDYNNMPLDMNFRQNLQSGSSMRQAPARQDSISDTSAPATKGVKNKVYQQKQRVVSDTKTENARKAAAEGKLNFYYNNSDSLTPEAVKVGLDNGMLVNEGGQLYRMEKDANGNLIRNTLPIANYTEDGNVVPKEYADLRSGQSFDSKARMTPEQLRQIEVMQNDEAKRNASMGMTRGMGAGPNSGSAWDNSYATGLVNSGINTVANVLNALGGGQNEMAGMSDYSQNYGGQFNNLAKQLGNLNGEVAQTIALPAGSEAVAMKGVGKLAQAIPSFSKAIKVGAHVLAPAAADAAYEGLNSVSRANTGRISEAERNAAIVHEGELGLAKGVAHALHLPGIVQAGVKAYADGNAILHRAAPGHGAAGHSDLSHEPTSAPRQNGLNFLAQQPQPVVTPSPYNPYTVQPRGIPRTSRPLVNVGKV